MINSKVYGFYEISLDGGKTFSNETKNLILNNYYNKTSFTNNMTLVIGSGNTPPELTDVSLGSQFGSSAIETDFDSNASRETFSDRFEITYNRLFDLGTGYNNTIRELGIMNPNLCSRALLTDPTGSPTEVPLVSTDHVLIRYSITYVVPRTPQVFSLIINLQPVNATVTAVNGGLGAWGNATFGEIVAYANIGADDAGTWTVNEDGEVIGSNITSGVSLTTNVSGDSGLKISGTAVSTTSQWVGTFQQLLITSSGSNYITAPILIDLDVPVAKTNTAVTTISINVTQGS